MSGGRRENVLPVLEPSQRAEDDAPGRGADPGKGGMAPRQSIRSTLDVQPFEDEDAPPKIDLPNLWPAACLCGRSRAARELIART
jgi:hypothetical protein